MTSAHSMRRMIQLGATAISMGPRNAANAAIRRALVSLGSLVDTPIDELPVSIEYLTSADELQPTRAEDSRAKVLHIGWICSPPSAGSGGHTTLFRMVKAAEERGHICTLLLYDKNSNDVARHEVQVRQWWPELKASIRSATGDLAGLDAIVASSWGTAHLLASRKPQNLHCFYFIQDYEPYFYPRGALYAFAEETYRFGFINIALGAMVDATIERETGIRSDVTVPFGCDLKTYRLLPRHDEKENRTGVVYYSKRTADRRGYLLAKLALEIFHKLHPEQEIHVYGDVVKNWRIPVTNHGTLSPSQLNELYNRTIASVALSFTNVTLVAEEMMAAGNVPVINDHPFSRAVLDSSGPIWTAATPKGIAAGLCAAICAENKAVRATRLSNMSRTDWNHTGALVASCIEKYCNRQPEGAAALFIANKK
ncbi:glycosyltransferase family 4 protein [Pseudarthrobacter sp. NIBRBAC000502771]|uniref:glycosyltransferase family 4 protein n=1 Tax=Pseudarthrobacter sp. NIBRBAC000502771 TaxID=2590774 RepID=UPI001131B43B|nr:glycosyltransferase family 4 protein [Pseudarthrobacter sp. NIBRBAC000502771]QDG61807.1 glycosyltransferase family 4 protein [Pseudarthrobacter sp. NIBRBAC000502771]